MSRLTKELTTNSNYEIQLIQKGFTYVTNTPYYDQIIYKLGILEDLEDKLGCPLHVIFKALKEGIYIKDLPKGYEKRKVTLNYLIKEKMFYFMPSAPYCYKLFLKDYGKTWCLKKDRSGDDE